MKSALYEGRVRHRRFVPVEHSFEYRIFYAYLDLDELPHVLDCLPGWSARRPAIARFAREDHLGEPHTPLDEAVRDAVESQCGTRPEGPIRLLTLPRTLGVAFNPVSFFYCHRPDGSLGHILAQVDNTPRGERHCYAVDVARDDLGKTFSASASGRSRPLLPPSDDANLLEVFQASPSGGSNFQGSAQSCEEGETSPMIPG